MIKNDLERLNEWWFTGKIRKELSPPFKRHVFQRILKSLEERQILLITGLRRIGKTTILYQTIEKLLEKVKPENILYFSFDEAIYNVKEVLEVYEKYFLRKTFEEAGRIYIFFDEIQYAGDWSSIVKSFYDLYPNLKFYISGSSTILLSKEALEKLAGRFFSLEMKPLTFIEYLEMRKIGFKKIKHSPRRLEIYFQDYLRKAGFPEIVDWENEERIREYIRNTVIDRIILRDLPVYFKTRDMLLLENIVKIILSNPGAIININTLSRNLGKSKITVSNYIKFLESSLLIRSLSNYRPSIQASSRKLRKYYPTTTSLIYAYSKEIFEKQYGKIIETYTVNTLNAKYYYRKGRKEIDIILKNKEIIPIEVKEKVQEKDIKKLRKIIKQINANKGIIISSNQKTKIENIEIIPVYLLEKATITNSK